MTVVWNDVIINGVKCHRGISFSAKEKGFGIQAISKAVAGSLWTVEPTTRSAAASRTFFGGSCTIHSPAAMLSILSQCSATLPIAAGSESDQELTTPPIARSRLAGSVCAATYVTAAF
jgi:hypothetical protein